MEYWNVVDESVAKKTSLGSLKEWKRSKCAAGKTEISLGRRREAKKAGLLVWPSKGQCKLWSRKNCDTVVIK